MNCKGNKEYGKHPIWWGIGIVLVVAVVIGLYGLVVMLLWNWLVPDLFKGPNITIWQSFGLILLSKLLLKGFSSKPSSFSFFKKFSKESWKDKVQNMDDDKKQMILQKLKERCSEFNENQDNEPNKDSKLQ